MRRITIVLFSFVVLIQVPDDVFGTKTHYVAKYRFDGCINDSGTFYRNGQIVFNVSRCELWRCVVTPSLNQAYMELTQCPAIRPKPGCRVVGPSTGRYPDCCPRQICDAHKSIVIYPAQEHVIVPASKYEPVIVHEHRPGFLHDVKYTKSIQYVRPVRQASDDEPEEEQPSADVEEKAEV